jgi:hypothetical protein
MRERARVRGVKDLAFQNLAEEQGENYRER